MLNLCNDPGLLKKSHLKKYIHLFLAPIFYIIIINSHFSVGVYLCVCVCVCLSGSHKHTTIQICKILFQIHLISSDPICMLHEMW